MSDVFGRGGDDGVAVGAKLLHLVGNPISQAIHSGFGSKPRTRGLPSRSHRKAM